MKHRFHTEGRGQHGKERMAHYTPVYRFIAFFGVLVFRIRAPGDGSTAVYLGRPTLPYVRPVAVLAASWRDGMHGERQA